MTTLTGLAIDVETGGLDPDTCALLRVGVVEVHHGRVVDEHDWRVMPAPGLDMDPEALRVNRWAPYPYAMFERDVIHLLSLLAKRLPDDTPHATIGHNVAWDIAVLRALTRRNRCPTITLPHRFADSAVLALPLQLSGEIQSRRLDDLVPAVLGRPRSPEAHMSPLVDAHDSLDVVMALCERYIR